MNATTISDALNIFYDNGDKRIRDKLFMGNPYAIVFCYMCYVILIQKILPKFMEKRDPFDYGKLMFYTDAILTLRSFYFLINGAYLWFFIYNWICQPEDLSGSWLSNYEVRICHEFVVSVFIYTLQSVVLVMCKKSNPVATYLLIHHTIFPIMLWVGANFYPGGHGTFAGFINAFTHFHTSGMRVVTTIFPKSSLNKYRKSIDVKLHIFQFLIVFVHAALILFQPNCSVPVGIAYWEMIGALVIAVIYNRYVLNASERRKDCPKLELVRTT
ncbi:very long chain fatty acid elongase 7-like [Chironomus tepperi]|uniref:very long chain fatty acid elongase 7-like n=1 Tax=Chironomus tepperi TaxID=113505 RepID=UPI00391F83D3